MVSKQKTEAEKSGGEAEREESKMAHGRGDEVVEGLGEGSGCADENEVEMNPKVSEFLLPAKIERPHVSG
jgi:hypothetical protein